MIQWGSWGWDDLKLIFKSLLLVLQLVVSNSKVGTANIKTRSPQHLLAKQPETDKASVENQLRLWKAAEFADEGVGAAWRGLAPHAKPSLLTSCHEARSEGLCMAFDLVVVWLPTWFNVWGVMLNAMSTAGKFSRGAVGKCFVDSGFRVVVSRQPTRSSTMRPKVRNPEHKCPNLEPSTSTRWPHA